jgi:hypothetical protein
MKDCRPFGAALRGEASNRPLLRWLKTVVVSDEGKGARDASGGVQEGVALKVPRGIHRLTASLFREEASKPGVTAWPGIEPGGYPITGQVVPGAEVARAWTAAFVRNVGKRAPILPPWKRGGERESSKRLKRKELSTVAGRAGGPVRSSGEVPA